MKRKIVECLATGFYIGRIPKAPGTFGTLLGIPLVLALKNLPPLGYMAGCLAFLVFSAVIAGMYEKFTGHHDTSEIVIDEVLGYAIAMTWLPVTVPFLIAGFLAFRLFDIWKPGPIRKLDEKIEGGLGTILDDVAAGLAANLVLQLIYVNTDWLGQMWNGTSVG